MPFFVMGSIGIFVATLLVLVIPDVKPDPIENASGKSLTFKDIAKSPTIFLPYLDLCVCLFGYGLISSMLTPHLEKAGANSDQIGLTFLVYGAIFMLSTPIPGFVSF